MRPQRTRSSTTSGFTLIELAMVVLIIGLISSFLLVVAFEGLSRARERGTQSLIQKLDLAVSDRLEALESQSPPISGGHRFLSWSVVNDDAGNSFLLDSPERAQVIARADYIRSELPDVFFLQIDPNEVIGGAGNASIQYPLNFGALPYATFPRSNEIRLDPVTGLSYPTASWQYFRYTLPLGVGVAPPSIVTVEGTTTATGISNFRSPAGTGIFGASYQAIAGINRQLGYHQLGTNGVDDDADGLVDELQEGLFDNAIDPITQLPRDQTIALRLSRHTHITARSEMLYAVLIESAGPLGTSFNADDFNENEVADTDGDGLLEFVDAWGNPLQFHRWPVYYVSDYASARTLQKGGALYNGVQDPREQNPIDPNQLLMDPAWWGRPIQQIQSNNSDDASQISIRANLFQQHFFSLIDPSADAVQFDPTAPPTGLLWDRTDFYKRRAYFSKFLIVSAGPDEKYGVGNYGLTYDLVGDPDDPESFTQEIAPPAPLVSWEYSAYNPGDGAAVRIRAAELILIENQAGRLDPGTWSGTTIPQSLRSPRNLPRNGGSASGFRLEAAGTGRAVQLHQGLGDSAFINNAIQNVWGVDDLSNHVISKVSGIR